MTRDSPQFDFLARISTIRTKIALELLQCVWFYQGRTRYRRSSSKTKRGSKGAPSLSKCIMLEMVSVSLDEFVHFNDGICRVLDIFLTRSSHNHIVRLFDMMTRPDQGKWGNQSYLSYQVKSCLTVHIMSNVNYLRSQEWIKENVIQFSIIS